MEHGIIKLFKLVTDHFLEGKKKLGRTLLKKSQTNQTTIFLVNTLH